MRARCISRLGRTSRFTFARAAWSDTVKSRPEKSKLLIVGGSGFVSGALARRAVAEDHDVYVVTRGERPLPDGVHAITVDRRNRSAFLAAFEPRPERFDLVVDCICYTEKDANQDVEVFSGRCGRFVFISTDSVYDPAARSFPQDESDAVFLTEGYGGDKRKAELVFEQVSTGVLPWTILRPCHIYGKGSHLGCIPRHAREAELVGRMRSGQPLELVGGGRSLLQPLYVDDLIAVILACRENRRSIGGVYNVAGPETIEARRYYEIIAEALSVAPRYVEVPFGPYWESEPQYRGYLCHRLQSLERLGAVGLPVPATPPTIGLPIHVRSLTGAR